MESTDNLLTYWGAYQRAQHCTKRTIREREIFMRSVLRRTGAESLLAISKMQLVMFLGNEEYAFSAATKMNYRSTLHTFFTWLQDEGFRLDNPAAKLPRAKREPTEPNPTDTADIAALLPRVYRRTRMMILLYAYQGFRPVEIAAVHGAMSFDWEGGRILSRDGKGGKVVWRPLHSMVLEYAIAAGFTREDWWFPGLVPGEHVTAKSVSRTLADALRRAGIEHRPHDFRKWHGTTMLDNGADGKVVQDSLRHTDGQSLHIYTRPSQHRIREAMEALPRVPVPLHSARGRGADTGGLLAA